MECAKVGCPAVSNGHRITLMEYAFTVQDSGHTRKSGLTADEKGVSRGDCGPPRARQPKVPSAPYDRVRVAAGEMAVK